VVLVGFFAVASGIFFYFDWVSEAAPDWVSEAAPDWVELALTRLVGLEAQTWEAVIVVFLATLAKVDPTAMDLSGVFLSRFHVYSREFWQSLLI
jgi:hypothetical protein